MPQLFEKFYRADDPVVRRTSGTGLGLYIVRSLVTMLGGQVHVRSRHGKGTVFTVTVPRAEPTARTRPRLAVGAHQQVMPPPKRILIVDDEALIGKATHLALDKAGYEGAEA